MKRRAPSVIDLFRSTVPAGVSGEWSVRKFTVTPEDEKRQMLRAWRDGRYVPAGDYTGLYHGAEVIMSDTPDEIRDHLRFYYAAVGDVLINGLGLGCCLAGALAKPEVKHVTVIEFSADVIKLVAPSFSMAVAAGRLEIIHADAYTWRPPKGKRYDAVWHDIWPNICADNLDGMKKLHRRYGRKTGWQGSWARAQAERQNIGGWW